MKKPYLPRKEADRIIWLNNLSATVATNGASLGLTAAEITLIANFAKFYGYIIGLIVMSKAYTKQLTDFKNSLSIAPLNTTSLGEKNLRINIRPFYYKT